MTRSAVRYEASSVDTSAQTGLKLLDFFPYHLSFAADLMSAEIAEVMEEKTGMSMMQWRVMAVIGTFSPVSTRDVAAYTTMNKVAVSRAVASLVDMKMLACRPDAVDNRLLAISFTPRGEKAFEIISREAISWARQLLMGFGKEDVAMMLLFLKRLQENISRLRGRRIAANIKKPASG